MPDKKLFHNDANGNEMTRPRGPDWNEDIRSWAVMDCRGDWVKCGDRYDVAATIHINDMKYYVSLLEELLEKLEG